MRPFLSTHLPKSARVLPITLVLTVLLALGGGVAFAVHLASQASVVSAVNPGQPAISVTLPGKAPAFTEADVRAFYTASHGFPNGRTPTGGIPPIASITFMSREQAEANVTHHESLSELPTGALVCVLMVQGPLIHVGGGGAPPPLTAPGMPTPTPAPIKPADSGYMIFDASTGNLILFGF